MCECVRACVCVHACACVRAADDSCWLLTTRRTSQLSCCLLTGTQPVSSERNKQCNTLNSLRWLLLYDRLRGSLPYVQMISMVCQIYGACWLTLRSSMSAICSLYEYNLFSRRTLLTFISASVPALTTHTHTHTLQPQRLTHLHQCLVYQCVNSCMTTVCVYIL